MRTFRHLRPPQGSPHESRGPRLCARRHRPADIVFLRANIVDEFGNMVFLGTTNNFNPLMATAADYVVVEAEKLVKEGEITRDRNQIHECKGYAAVGKQTRGLSEKDGKACDVQSYSRSADFPSAKLRRK